MGNTCSGGDRNRQPAVKSFTYKGGNNQKVPKDANCVSIKLGVKSIEAATFQFCPSIIAVVDIPPSVIVIQSDAFNGCSNLTKIHIPSSVQSIGAKAFHKCTSLSTVRIDSSSPSSTSASGLTSTPPVPALSSSSMSSLSSPTSPTSHIFQIGEEAFLDCKQLKSINLPETLTKIGKYAFFGCTSLSSVTIHPSSTITTIEPSTFGSCTSLTKITLPQNQNFKTISRAAFYKCAKLKSIHLPPSLKTIGPDAFYGCSSLVRLAIPSSVQHFDMSAFQYCHELQHVNIHPNVTTLPHTTAGNASTALYAFQGCDKLVSISIPSDVTSIGMYSFKGCTSLIYAYLPPSITSIGESAFENCRSLSSIVLPEGVRSDYAGAGTHMSRIGTNAFRNCRTLQRAFMGSRYFNPEGDLNTYDDFVMFLKNRFDGLPLHYDCYRYPNYPKAVVRSSIGGVARGSIGGVSPRGSIGGIARGSIGGVSPRGSIGGVSPRGSIGGVSPRRSIGGVVRTSIGGMSVVGGSGGVEQKSKVLTPHEQLRGIVSSYTDSFGSFTIDIVTNDGFEMTPLHVLASNPNADMAAIQIFLDALPPCHKIIESARMKTLHGMSVGIQSQQQQQLTQSQSQSQSVASYSPLQLYMKSRALSQISLIKALKQGLPWSFIEEITSERSSVDEILTADEGKESTEDWDGTSMDIDIDSASSTKGLYPFMISASQRNCKFETTFKLALSSIELLQKN
eukprot:CAMPEP_0203666354 /NCGR_PEP_ID=MMETSP0090-20130426/3400_1 /ASSEMBLY_ACC=CAM_ASM_001088 /TAXON_ID=426623 /ORGANISM="Chaetoceros affinis, Strain CCMP159" /LENGTH=731 /DNA_ID=CAMNT_0050530205 /DNA_START=203 /DNA_END=2398 /DNA_ORIENTATION=+